MALKTTNRLTNGHARRKCISWIERFVDHTKGLESAPIFRRWTAIATIAAVLQRKVWIETQGIIYPNMYVFLVGKAAIGKSRPINFAESLVKKLEDITLAPTSTTMASLTDKLEEANRIVPIHPPPALEYNSLFIMADELSAFMNDFQGQNDLIAGLTKYYDCSPYSQARRGGSIHRVLEKPQLNILSGSTPSNILHFIPDWAWDQGFTSRIILVYSTEQYKVNPFTTGKLTIPEDLMHDLEEIDTIVGQFGWTEEYAYEMNKWREEGMEPMPDHPRLDSYNGRRFVHMIKLTMVSAIDRGNDLMLTKTDYERAKKWILEAEAYMPEVFREGAGTPDSKAINEIHHFILQYGDTPEHRVKNFARNIINVGMIMPTIDLMVAAQLITIVGYESIGTRIFRATAETSHETKLRTPTQAVQRSN